MDVFGMTNVVILDKRHVNYIENNLEQVRHIINNHGNCLKKVLISQKQQF